MKKLLFKSIDEIKEYITVDISSDFDTIYPYVPQAEVELKKIIGEAVYKDLLTVVHDGNDDENLKELLEYVREPLAYFTYFISVDFMMVNVGDTGLTVTSSNSVVPASDKKIEIFRNALQKSANSGLELLLNYLENNSESFPKWKLSNAYSYNKLFFINNATELNLAIYKEVTRLDFLNLKPHLFKSEESEIAPAICRNLFDELKLQIKEQNISAPNKLLLDNYIRPAVCYSALQEFDKEKYKGYKQEAARRIELLRRFLEDNEDNYFKYKDSDCYSGKSDFQAVNSADKGIFICGR